MPDEPNRELVGDLGGISPSVTRRCANNPEPAHVLVSAGGTQEPWDEVRFLGNRSTGRQGCEIAAAARDAGSRVTLVEPS